MDRRLEAIAGPPLAMLTVPNTASGPLDIAPTEARTLYAVGSTTATANSTPIANLGGSGNGVNGEGGVQVIRSQDLGVGGLKHRAQVIGGTAVFQTVGGGWPWDMPLAACGWWDGYRFYAQVYGSSTFIIGASQAGEMKPGPCLRMAPLASSVTPAAALAYRGIHDLATRTRILGWLMQRYQVTPPPLDSTPLCCRRADLVLAA